MAEFEELMIKIAEEIHLDRLSRMDLIGNILERRLAGYPAYSYIRQSVPASDYVDVAVEIPFDEIWKLDREVHGDIYPYIFKVTARRDGELIMDEQRITESNLEMAYTAPLILSKRLITRIENTDTIARTYELSIFYCIYNRSAINSLLKEMNLEKIK